MSFYRNQLNKLANKFEKKIKIAQTFETSGDNISLFFGNKDNYDKFVTAANASLNAGAMKKVFDDIWAAKEVALSVDLKSEAVSKDHAKWIWNVNPPEALDKVKAALNSVFQPIVGTSMSAQEIKANTGAKSGGGTAVNGDKDRAQMAIKDIWSFKS